MNYNRELVDLEIQSAKTGQNPMTPQQYDESLKNYHKIVDPSLRAPIMQQYIAAYNEGAAQRGAQPFEEPSNSPISKAVEAVKGQITQIPADRQDLTGPLNAIRKIFATKAAGPLGQRVNDINAIAKE